MQGLRHSATTLLSERIIQGWYSHTHTQKKILRKKRKRDRRNHGRRKVSTGRSLVLLLPGMGSAVIFYSEIFPAQESEENGVRDTRVITFQRKKNEENGERDAHVLTTQIFCVYHTVWL